jgi:hypothetical protein
MSRYYQQVKALAIALFQQDTPETEQKAQQFIMITNYRRSSENWQRVVARAPQCRTKKSNRLHIGKATRRKHRKAA